MWAFAGVLMIGLLAVALFGFALLRIRHRYLERQRADLGELLGPEGRLTGFAPGTAVRSLSMFAWLGIVVALLLGEVVIAAVDEALGSWAVLVPAVALAVLFAAAVLGASPSARVVAFTADARMHLVRCSPGWTPVRVVESVPVVDGNPVHASRWVRKATFAEQRVRFSTLGAVGEVPTLA